jgi:hypothetical protein
MKKDEKYLIIKSFINFKELNEGKKAKSQKPKPLFQLFVYVPKTVHPSILRFIDKNFKEEFHKSPWSHSYYSDKVDWNSKPDKSYRLSDHWNFYTKGKYHCETTTPVENNTHWSLGQYNAEKSKYEILLSYPKVKDNSSVADNLKMKNLKNYKNTEKYIDNSKENEKNTRMLNVINLNKEKLDLYVNNNQYLLKKIKANKIQFCNLDNPDNCRSIKFSDFLKRTTIEIKYGKNVVYFKEPKNDPIIDLKPLQV